MSNGACMRRYLKPIPLLLAGLLSGVVCAIMILCAVPPVSRDALTHHLAVPKLYLNHGGIYEIPSIVFSYYPMNLDLLYWLCLYLGSDIIPKYIHFAFALLTAGLIFNYLKKTFNRNYALLGALLFLTIPIIVKLSITVYVDLGLIFFSTAALLTLLQWKENDFQWRYLCLSAVSCGLALGTKYNGLILLLCLTAMVPLMFMRLSGDTGRKAFKSLGMAAVYMSIALLFFSPWMIKNYLWTGNPVYPLYNKWFNVDTEPDRKIDPVRVQDPRQKSAPATKPKVKFNHFNVRKLVYGESTLETMTIPLRIFFQGQDNQPKFFDGKLNPFLLLLPLAALLGWRRESSAQRQDMAILFCFAIGYLIFVFVQIDMRIRWISPIVPALTILSIFGLRQVVRQVTNQSHLSGKAIFATILFAAVLLPLGLNLSYIYKQFQTVQPWEYISGAVSRNDYITRYRPEYPVIVRANQTLDVDAKILALFLGNRIYYSDRKIESNYGFFFKGLSQDSSSKALYQRLKQKGITHVLMRFDLVQHRLEKVLGRHERKVLTEFLQTHLRRIHAQNGYGLFKLENDPSSNEK